MSASGTTMAAELVTALVEHPVTASVIGPANVDRFAAAPARLGIVASVPVGDLRGVVDVLDKAGKTVFVNLDSTPGLGHDQGALAYLQKLGVTGVCTTRATLIERAPRLELLTMQKTWVTDRSNLERTLNSVARARPDVIQVMPAIMLTYVEQQLRALRIPYLAAGFVQSREDVAAALERGAVGTCSSDPRLWHLRREDLQAEPGQG